MLILIHVGRPCLLIQHYRTLKATLTYCTWKITNQYQDKSLNELENLFCPLASAATSTTSSNRFKRPRTIPPVPTQRSYGDDDGEERNSLRVEVELSHDVRSKREGRGELYDYAGTSEKILGKRRETMGQDYESGGEFKLQVESANRPRTTIGALNPFESSLPTNFLSGPANLIVPSALLASASTTTSTLTRPFIPSQSPRQISTSPVSTRRNGKTTPSNSKATSTKTTSTSGSNIATSYESFWAQVAASPTSTGGASSNLPGGSDGLLRSPIRSARSPSTLTSPIRTRAPYIPIFAVDPDRSPQRRSAKSSVGSSSLIPSSTFLSVVPSSNTATPAALLPSSHRSLAAAASFSSLPPPPPLPFADAESTPQDYQSHHHDSRRSSRDTRTVDADDDDDEGISMEILDMVFGSENSQTAQ
jgi:hypothetical protein